MTHRQEQKMIKSAQRTLEILEYFSKEQQSATVMKIARFNGYPQSSTSELLNCLVTLGYLHYDPTTRLYRPSIRAAFRGARICPNLTQSQKILALMENLSDQTGASIVLGSRIDIWMQYIHVIPGIYNARINNVGTRDLLTRSPSGKLLLSALDRNHARNLIHRINSEVETDLRVPAGQLLVEIRELEVRKFAGGVDHNDRKTGIISTLLPRPAGTEQLTIGLHCSLEDLKRNIQDYVNILKSNLTMSVAPTHNYINFLGNGNETSECVSL